LDSYQTVFKNSYYDMFMSIKTIINKLHFRNESYFIIFWYVYYVVFIAVVRCLSSLKLVRRSPYLKGQLSFVQCGFYQGLRIEEGFYRLFSNGHLFFRGFWFLRVNVGLIFLCFNLKEFVFINASISSSCYNVYFIWNYISNEEYVEKNTRE